MGKYLSKLFGELEIPENEDEGFYDIVPKGFDEVVNLYIGIGTVQDKEAIIKAIEFFDRAVNLDIECRKIFLSSENDIVEEYFDFFKEESPEVFNTDDCSKLTLEEMVKKLKFHQMASHDNGEEQEFVVDFTLDPEEMLCVKFNDKFEFKSVDWES